MCFYLCVNVISVLLTLSVYGVCVFFYRLAGSGIILSFLYFPLFLECPLLQSIPFVLLDKSGVSRIPRSCWRFHYHLVSCPADYLVWCCIECGGEFVRFVLSQEHSFTNTDL